MDITLYGNRFSGHSYKVALFLKLNNIPYKYQTISLSQARPNRPEFFRKNARFDEVPLLIIDGQPFVQSNAILVHLSTKLGIMDGGTHQPQIMEWMMWEQSRLGHSLPNLRYEKKFTANANPHVSDWLAGRLRDDLDVLDAHLSQADKFIASNKPTIADCAIVGYLFWIEDADFNLLKWPHVQAWLTRISQLNGWQHPDQLLSI